MEVTRRLRDRQCAVGEKKEEKGELAVQSAAVIPQPGFGTSVDSMSRPLQCDGGQSLPAISPYLFIPLPGPPAAETSGIAPAAPLHLDHHPSPHAHHRHHGSAEE